MKPGPRPQGEIALTGKERQARYLAGLKQKASIPNFDPARDGVYERKMFEDMRDSLRDLVLKLERREADVARLTTRVAYLEAELKREEQNHTNTMKEVITLRQQLGADKR